MKIIPLEQIKEVLPSIDLIPAIEEGFIAYSKGQAVIPPVGELILEKGEAHIKYGYIKKKDYYTIKIASGFYDNTKIGLPSSNGLMLLFSQQTGELISILLDGGYLTDVRTAAAGAVVAKYLSPKEVNRIGIFGAGNQGRIQLKFLKSITKCKEAMVWGINQQELDAYKRDMEPSGFSIRTTMEAGDIASSCNLIVTCTPSKKPLLKAEQIKKGTHITAMGSDTPEKQELDSAILKKADIVVADSISQCLLRGEIYKAIQSNQMSRENIVELGNIITGESTGRTHENQITVSDLTGVAVQDIKIAEAVYKSAAL